MLYLIRKGTTITITKGTTYQAIDGFGAAANKPVYYLQNNMSAANQSAILDKLFNETFTHRNRQISLDIAGQSANPMLKLRLNKCCDFLSCFNGDHLQNFIETCKGYGPIKFRDFIAYVMKHTS
jgi:hypothetical protein